MQEHRLRSRLGLIQRTDYLSLYLAHWIICNTAASNGLVVRYQRNGELQHSSGLLSAALLNAKPGPAGSQKRARTRPTMCCNVPTHSIAMNTSPDAPKPIFTMKYIPLRREAPRKKSEIPLISWILRFLN